MSTAAPDRDDDRDVMTIDDVCRRAKVGRTFAYEEIRAGRLRAVKLGRLTRVLPADYRVWLAGAAPITPDDPTTILVARSNSNDEVLVGDATRKAVRRAGERRREQRAVESRASLARCPHQMPAPRPGEGDSAVDRGLLADDLSGLYPEAER